MFYISAVLAHIAMVTHLQQLSTWNWALMFWLDAVMLNMSQAPVSLFALLTFLISRMSHKVAQKSAFWMFCSFVLILVINRITPQYLGMSCFWLRSISSVSVTRTLAVVSRKIRIHHPYIIL